MLDDIREVNLSYLMLAQHLLRDDLASGMFRLGFDADVARVLLALSPAQTVRLASTGNLLCGFRLNDANLLKALRLDAKDAPTYRAVQQLQHVTILLAQQATSEEAK